MERKYNYVYRITNKINNKVYIGMHSTDNLEDGYMGSGIVLKRAQKKYGIDNFTKEILQMFDTRAEALEYEASIVTKEFIALEETYNAVPGGRGAQRSYNHSEEAKQARKIYYTNPDVRKMISERVKAAHSRPGAREKMSRIARVTQNKPETVLKKRNATLLRWQDKDYRKKAIESINAGWTEEKREEMRQKRLTDMLDDAKREQTLKALQKANTPEAQAKAAITRAEAYKRPEVKALRSQRTKESMKGRGWFHHPVKMINTRCRPEDVPEGYLPGCIPFDKANSVKRVYYKNIATGECIRIPIDETPPEGFVKGFINPHKHSQR